EESRLEELAPLDLRDEMRGSKINKGNQWKEHKVEPANGLEEGALEVRHIARGSREDGETCALEEIHQRLCDRKEQIGSDPINSDCCVPEAERDEQDVELLEGALKEFAGGGADAIAEVAKGSAGREPRSRNGDAKEEEREVEADAMQRVGERKRECASGCRREADT